MILWLIILFLIGTLIFNIIYYIPNKLRVQEYKMSLHFRELHLRLNRLEQILEDNKID